jgi:hypothetical protein
MNAGKDDLRAALAEQRDELLKLCDAMGDILRRTPLDAGQWSVHDWIGHLSYWEGNTLDQITQTFKEGRPRPILPDATDDEINEREAAKRKTWSWERVRAEFVNTRNALIQRVDALSESDLQFSVPSPWLNDTRMITLETLVREDVRDHGTAHLAEIRTWQKQNQPPQA